MTLTTSGINYVVDVAFGVDPLAVPGGGAWVDVTDYVRGFSTRRGRNHELGKTQAGVASITLDNRDRRFDPTFATSPYFPNVVPMAHVRIRATYLAVTYPVFYGFVEDWGQTWPAPAANAQGDALVELQAADAFKVFNMQDVRSYPAEVLADDPLLFYPFDDAPGTTLILNRGSLEGDAGTLTVEDLAGVILGAAGPLPGGAGAVTLNDDGATGQQLTTDQGGSADLDKPPLGWTVEFWLDWPATTSDLTVVKLGTTVGSFRRWLLRLDAAVADEWAIEYTRPNGDTVTVQMTGATATAGVFQHWAFTRSGSQFNAYRNGVLVSTQTNVANVAPDGVPTLEVGTVVDDTGDMADLAVYDHALTAERIAAHYAANVGAFAAQQTGERIDVLLGALGWPAGLRNLDAGVSSVPAMNVEGSALDVLGNTAEETEQGVFLMAADNTATFIDRAALFANLTAAATFGDGAGEVPYRDLILSYDDQDLWTQVAASGVDVAATVSDAAATTRYGLRTLETSGLEATVNGINDVANGLLARYKAPAVRPRTLTLNKPAAFPQMLGRLIGDRVTVKRRPPGGGTVTVDAIIEGVNHDAGPDGWLSTTFALVPVEPLAFWILGNATYGVLDSTTRLGW